MELLKYLGITTFSLMTLASANAQLTVGFAPSEALGTGDQKQVQLSMLACV